MKLETMKYRQLPPPSQSNKQVQEYIKAYLKVSYLVMPKGGGWCVVKLDYRPRNINKFHQDKYSYSPNQRSKKVLFKTQEEATRQAKKESKGSDAEVFVSVEV